MPLAGREHGIVASIEEMSDELGFDPYEDDEDEDEDGEGLSEAIHAYYYCFLDVCPPSCSAAWTDTHGADPASSIWVSVGPRRGSRARRRPQTVVGRGSVGRHIAAAPPQPTRVNGASTSAASDQDVCCTAP